MDKNNKSISKDQTSDKSVVKQETPAELRARMIKSFVAQDNPSLILSKMDKMLNLYRDAPNEAEKDKLLKQLDKLYEKAASATSLDNHFRLGASTTQELRPLVIDMCNQLIVEYDCKTVSEKTLAEIIAGAYVRILRYSTSLNNSYAINDANPNLNAFRANASKELDRAHRQYMFALTTLKQIKSPFTSLNVKAQTAFMGTNQQINLNKVEDNENNKPK